MPADDTRVYLGPPPTAGKDRCQCRMGGPSVPCKAAPTQEDLLCDTCRPGQTRVVSSAGVEHHLSVGGCHAQHTLGHFRLGGIIAGQIPVLTADHLPPGHLSFNPGTITIDVPLDDFNPDAHP